MEEHVVLAPEVHAYLEEAVRPAEPEGGCLLLARLSTGKRRVRFLAYRALVPNEGEVAWRKGPNGTGLHFDTEYIARAQNEALRDDATIIFVHTHPGDEGPTFSRKDRLAEEALFGVLSKALRRPLASLLIGEPGRYRARAWRMREGTLVPTTVRRVDVAGPHLTMNWTLDAKLAEAPNELADRSIRLWGETGQQILQNLRVGIAGAGGVASYDAEGLARLGVGDIIQIDFDVMERVNVSRNAGSTHDDVGTRKVAVLKEWLSKIATADNFQDAAIDGRVQDHVQDLLDCDVIVSAMDGYDARDVVNEIAYRHFIGVIDCGTQLDPNDEKTRIQYAVLRAQYVGVGAACLWCTGYLTRERITHDRLPAHLKKAANYGVEEHAPAVFFTNAITMGLVGMLVLEHVLHLIGKMPGELRHNVLTWILSPEHDERTPGCECERVYACGDEEPPAWTPKEHPE